jgi:hypothetical protein
MRVAVCYSGGLRTFKKCYEQNHRVLSQLGELDYYMVTWEKPCYTKVARYDDIHAVMGDTIYEDLLKPDDIITTSYLNNILKFKICKVESMDIMNLLINSCKDMSWHIMSPSRLICQYYMMSVCNAWKNVSDIKYDLVVKLRPDVTISNIPADIDPDKFYINNIVYKDTKADIMDMINEMIYISNPENMNKMCNIYKNFRDLWEIQTGYGERVSRNNLEREGLLDKCEYFDFGITVIRENGKNEYIK